MLGVIKGDEISYKDGHGGDGDDGDGDYGDGGGGDGGGNGDDDERLSG
jgi:hypothetical protein